MINPIEWFQAKGFTSDDKITIKDVIELQNDASEEWIKMAEQLAAALNSELLGEFGYKQPCIALDKFNAMILARKTRHLKEP